MAPELQTVSMKAAALSSRAWEALTPPLAEWILDAVSSMGFKRMTPVQASTIPQFLGNKDVVVEAVTGSGKTLAYLIPILEKLLRLEEQIKRHHVGAIILSPTRELATQIYNVLQSLLAFHGPSAAAMEPLDDEGDSIEAKIQPDMSQGPGLVTQLLVGGDTSTSQDLSNFLKKSPTLLVATPGRLLELLSSTHVKCPQSSFEILVLDEADRLLDLGFRDDLQKILGRLPKQRRTGLFSASVSEAVGEIVRVGLRNPVKITVKVKGVDGGQDRKTPSSLQMCYLITSASHKFPAVSKLLSALERPPSKTIIFLSTCAAVDYFQHVLPSILPSPNSQSFKLVPLHGKHPAKARIKNLAVFTNSNTPSILLTTDVAARGLDIPQTDLVIQVDPPSDPKVFLHRCGYVQCGAVLLDSIRLQSSPYAIGFLFGRKYADFDTFRRSGRAGRKGLSVVLLQPGREEDYIAFLEVRKTPITPLSNPSVDTTDDDARAATEAIRQTMLSDRAFNDKAKRGFVSWVRSYSKHQASSIFRVGDLDWEDLGNAWGLLKLPKMPELKKWDGDRSLGIDIDWDAYAYKDKKREDMRKRALAESNQASKSVDTGPLRSEQKQLKRAWSKKQDARNEKEIRRSKKRTKREREKWEKMTPAEREKQRELERLIDEVKARKADEDKFGTFEGFDD